MINRKELYETILDVVKKCDLYSVFLSLDIPKTVNKNGITVNLSAISENNILKIYDHIKNIRIPTENDTNIEEPIPENQSQNCLGIKPIKSYKKLKLNKIQETILKTINC